MDMTINYTCVVWRPWLASLETPNAWKNSTKQLTTNHFERYCKTKRKFLSADLHRFVQIFGDGLMFVGGSLVSMRPNEVSQVGLPRLSLT